MKVSTTLAALALMSLGFYACQNTGEKNKRSDQPMAAQSISEAQMDYFIVADSANRMIGSYLSSIGDTNDIVQDDQLQSLILNADALRTYLSDNKIKQVKVMFAHTLEYINNGHYGQPAGYTPDELTIVIAGYDEEGNYVLAPGNMVPDHSKPCPAFCSATGTAASPLLPVLSN